MLKSLISSRPESEALFKKAAAVLPGGVNSPVRAFYGLNMTPLIVDRGEGSLIWDVDGNSYIDYCGSWGALILGHAHPSVVQAATQQIQRGSSFGLTTAIEEKLAAAIISLIPSIEKIRFVSSGTEAVMSAVRLARGYTGKSLVVKFDGNYHGHADQFLTGAGSGVSHLPACPGIPQEMVRSTLSLKYNDIEGVRALFRNNCNIAAVVLEPIAANMGLVPASSEFLEMLRQETKKAGALLIFDEVVTGFRSGLQGAQGEYGIEPDLTTLGKIIGGGFPAAAFGGKKEIMDHLAPLGMVYQAGTLSGNPVAMAAGYAALQEVQRPNFYDELEKKTRAFCEPVSHALRNKGIRATLAQKSSMFSLFFGQTEVTCQQDLDKELFRKLFVYLFERGIYLAPSAYETCFISSAHTDEQLLYTQEQICAFIEQL